ncbi:MAG: hypothetical protein WCH46_04350 [bacterium]
MRLLFFIFTVLFCFSPKRCLLAQVTPAIEWLHCYGGSQSDIFEHHGNSNISQTHDGGYIFVGTTSSKNRNISGNHGGSDALVIKVNSVGSIQWQRCLGGSGNDAGYSIIETRAGKFVMAGVTGSNDGDVIHNHGGTTGGL